MTLSEFLTARLDEDEAKWASAVPPWTAPHDPDCNYPGDMPGTCTCDLLERLKAQCAAHRRIVEACGPVVAYESYEGPDYYGGTEACELTLRALASIYADHESYDPAWRLN